MRKKTLTIFLIIILLSTTLIFASCGKDDFVEVCEVQYTTNGVTKTEHSTYSIYSNNSVESITKQEFDAAGGNSHSSPFGNKNLSKEFKTITTNAKTKGDTYYYAVLAWGDGPDFGQVLGKDYDYNYYKYEFSGYNYNYIKVKVVDSTTIIVRNKQGDTTYTVSSYRITNFE